MFSVGVEPTRAAFDTDGVYRVTAGDWVELSLLTVGAFDAARVASVTAQQGETMTVDSDEEVELEADEAEAAEEEAAEEEAEAIETVGAAGAGHGVAFDGAPAGGCRYSPDRRADLRGAPR